MHIQGELEHRHVKRFYARTNKNRHELQIAQHTRRAEKLRIIKARVDAARKKLSAPSTEQADGDDTPPAPSPACDEEDAPSVQENAKRVAYGSPSDRYHIAESQRENDDITAWVSAHRGDPAFKVFHPILSVRTCVHADLGPFDKDFIPRLKDHILSRRAADNDVSAGGHGHTALDHLGLHIANNRIYHHRVFRVNYTTYDIRRAQDSINPRTHADIMLLAPTHSHSDASGSDSDTSTDDDDLPHPFLYARVIGILHVNIRPRGDPTAELERVDVLWVRWFALDRSFTGGFKTKRLHRLEFVKDTENDAAFGFVDPQDVVRGMHIMPAFAHKRTSDRLGPSPAARVGSEHPDDLPLQDQDTDFRYYYTNM